ncbi:hypothetical protein ABPG75_007323 [Micractinium tetrahymenae]
MLRAALLLALLAAGLVQSARCEITPVRAEEAAIPGAYSECAPSTSGGTAKQSGLVNVQGIYVQAGCIQVVATVGACVQVGSLIGTGYCLPGGQSTTVGAPQLPVTLPTPAGTPPGPVVTLPGPAAQPGQITGSRGGLLGSLGGLLGGAGR